MPYQYMAPQPYYQQMFGQPMQMQQPAQATMQPTQMSAAPAGLPGRMVTSREEALGVPADFSGQPMVFPDLAHGSIYLKQFNAQTGASEFKEFRAVEISEADTKKPSFASAEDLQGLRDEMQKLREELEAVKAAKQKPIKVVTVDE